MDLGTARGVGEEVFHGVPGTLPESWVKKAKNSKPARSKELNPEICLGPCLATSFNLRMASTRWTGLPPAPPREEASAPPEKEATGSGVNLSTLPNRRH